MAKPASFEEVIAVTPLTSHSYSANLDGEWIIIAVPHGGYVCSLFYNVARTHMLATHPKAHHGDPRPMAIHMSYLRRTFVGPAVFQVRDMKIGARTSTLHVALAQKDKKGEYVEEVVAYITLTNFAKEDGPDHHFPFQMLPHDAPPPIPNFELLSTKKTDGTWIEYIPFRAKDPAPSAAKQVEFFVPATEGGSVNDLSAKGITQEWVRFKPYGKLSGWTEASVCSLIDHFPAILGHWTQTEMHWYPTVLMNVDIKMSLPAEGVEWLQLQAQVRKVQNGRFDVDVVILDREGDIVALSTQVALVLPASRNMAGREVKL
ncbi:hypothetical protein KEM56_004151 [Ascosphaera pollenicola]|nr:hypothetical protein KEM56_004151 [Ascosphaera pollenicola]